MAKGATIDVPIGSGRTFTKCMPYGAQYVEMCFKKSFKPLNPYPYRHLTTRNSISLHLANLDFGLYFERQLLNSHDVTKLNLCSDWFVAEIPEL